MKNFNKKIGKLMTSLLALMFALGATGCNTPPAGTSGGTDPTYNEDTTTIIKIRNFGGGVGRAWLDEAGKRFYELTKGTSYEDGKMGVGLDVENPINVDAVGISDATTHIYFDQNSYGTLYELMQSGKFLDISDVVTGEMETINGQKITLGDKIDESYHYSMKASDGKYYMLPHYEFYAGVSYDVDLFTSKGLYLAKQGSGTDYECDLTGETVYFTGKESEKTVGNDGIAGTDDDGLPTTLNELVAQCDYIWSEYTIPVFSVAGNHIDYMTSLENALWASLAGYEQRSAMYKFTGTVECVKLDDNDNFLYTNEDIWAGTGIKKPVTETVSVTEATGYKAMNQAAKYYAEAFLELAYKQGWIYNKYKESNYMHKDAMRAFIMNGISGQDKIASHVEASYWYNEMENYGLMDDYKLYTQSETDKKVAMWHLPTTYGTEKVTGEANAREEALINDCISYAFVNGNLDDTSGNEGIIRACKDFLKFLYTDAELKAFTVNTGVTKAKVEYSVGKDLISNLSFYHQTVMNARENNRVVQQEDNNPTFIANSTTFNSRGGILFKPHFAGADYTTFLEAYYRANKTVKDCFAATGYTSSKWLSEIYRAQ